MSCLRRMRVAASRLPARAGAVAMLLVAIAPAQTLVAQSGATHAATGEEDSVAVRLALLHMAPVLGKISPNIDTLTAMTRRAFQGGADIVVGPELATTGYSITAQQIRDSLGLRAPFSRLGAIRGLAMRFNGYVAFGIAEIADTDSLYNSVILFEPDGSFSIQRKRGSTGFGPSGDLPFTVIPSRFGDLGLVICSNVYLQDWPRILALAGADIVLSPANWWGTSHQLDIWSTRAHENDFYFVVANRWGAETDTRYGSPFYYDMNDAPSAVLAPGTRNDEAGQTLLAYRTETAPEPGNVVLRHTIRVSRARLGGGHRAYTVRGREPAAYRQISNPYYRPDLGNQPYPGLPPAGEARVAVLAMNPGFDPSANVAKVQAEWTTGGGNADVLVLPARAITDGPTDTSSPTWTTAPHWAALQNFVNTSGVQLLATSILQQTGTGTPVREALVVMRPGQPVLLRPAIHAWPPAAAAPQEPLYVDLAGARVGVVLGRDLLFPEVSLALAKVGADIVVSPAIEGVAPPRALPGVQSQWPYNAWLVRTNDGVHVAAANQGWGIIVRSGGGVIDTVSVADANGPAFRVLAVSSGTVRSKFLNAYRPFDLAALGLPPTLPPVAAVPTATPRADLVRSGDHQAAGRGTGVVTSVRHPCSGRL
jgi:predicted amidohydrolase